MPHMDVERRRPFSKIIDGLVSVALAVLVCVGLWQAYGPWLLELAKSHGG